MLLNIIRANFVVKLKKIILELYFNQLFKNKYKKANVEKFLKASPIFLVNLTTSNVGK